MNIRVNVVAAFLTTGLISACGTLPMSGPTRGTVQDEPKVGVRVIDVDDSVAKQIVKSRVVVPFSVALFLATAN